MKKIKIVHIPAKSTDFITFMSQLTEMLISNGYDSVSYNHFPHSFRALLGRTMSFTHFRNIECKSAPAYLVPMCGVGLITGSMPWGLFSEIVPFLWDCWPQNQKKLIKAIDLLKCKLVFVTSSQVQKIFQKECPNTQIVFIPEGIDTKIYNKGDILINRPLDIIEIGRHHHKYHDLILKMEHERKLKAIYNTYDSNGKRIKTMASTIRDLANLITTAKVAVSFPHCDTAPNYAGNIETLTQRYWESMLSRNIIIGRAPKELIDLIGYDPVINVDWNSPESQLLNILAHIGDYQSLVDKNYEAAQKFGGWEKRMDLITESLEKMGFVR